MTVRTFVLALISCAFLMPACGDDTAGTSDTGGQESIAPSPAGEGTDTSEDDPASDY